MKFYTSYFYQIRFFPPNLIPVSTAVWDPKWFHANKPQSYQFKDKRGVINGIRATVFAPGPELGGYCGKACGQVPPLCDFLLRYRAQLEQLDPQSVFKRFEELAQRICAGEGFEDVNFALILHEAPNNQCSERWAIQDWFTKQGVEITEWSQEFI